MMYFFAFPALEVVWKCWSMQIHQFPTVTRYGNPCLVKNIWLKHISLCYWESMSGVELLDLKASELYLGHGCWLIKNGREGALKTRFRYWQMYFSLDFTLTSSVKVLVDANILACNGYWPLGCTSQLHLGHGYLLSNNGWKGTYLGGTLIRKKHMLKYGPLYGIEQLWYAAGTPDGMINVTINEGWGDLCLSQIYITDVVCNLG